MKDYQATTNIGHMANIEGNEYSTTHHQITQSSTQETHSVAPRIFSTWKLNSHQGLVINQKGN